MTSRAATMPFLIASHCLVLSCAGDDDAAAAECGTWVRANFRNQPPPNATVYGMEYNPDGNFNQYVCRFQTQLDGKTLVLQGKGVFGYSCYAILPAGVSAVARLETSDDFEVLVHTASCAHMVPFREDQSNEAWLPTGSDVDGNPTYTCRALVNSLEGGSQATSMPLGRYEPETKRCVFEWYTQVRAAPEPGSTESFEMLAVP
jgi:hypothetical protein